MTRDETNEKCCEGINDPLKCTCRKQDPVASNTGKPYSHQPGMACVAADLRITSLEKQCNEWIARAESKDWRDEKIVELESSLEGMKKRKIEQQEEMDARFKTLVFQDEKIRSLEQKLKTAEDKLAGVKTISEKMADYLKAWAEFSNGEPIAKGLLLEYAKVKERP